MANNKPKYQPPKQVDKPHEVELKDIGKKLEKLRDNTGLSVSGFAAEIGISRNSYSLMEKGEIYFSLRNLLIILDYHGLDLKKFIEADIENL